MTRILLTFSIALTLVSCGSSSNPKNNFTNHNKSRPNIVLILTDDMRWDLMSIVNHPYLKTPTLDKLAQEGVLFENAFIPVAACSPSRAALLSGREVHRASAPGIYWRNNSFLETQITFPQILHDNGYNTGYIGKWHLGDGKTPKPGFNQWESFDALGSFWNTTLWVNGKKEKFTGFSDDIIAERTVNFIKKASKSPAPFFAMVGFKEPHLPFASATRFKTAFDKINIPQPESIDEDFSISGKEEISWLKIRTSPAGIPRFGSWNNYIKSHYRGILGLDSAVNKIVNTLKETDEFDNTIFIYTSDNGYSLGEHGLTEKHLTYEEPIRVPMLVRYPKEIKPGIRKSELVSSIDLAPTILDYAGINIPEYMDGKSWKPLLSNKLITKWRDQLFFWLHAFQKTLRTSDYKLIESLHTQGHFELYDLKDDPKELINRYKDPAYSDIKKSMHARLKKEVQRIGWTERTYTDINSIYVSQPMTTTIAIQTIKRLSLAPPPLKSNLPDTLDGKILWEKSVAENKNFYLADTTNTEQQSIIVTIPIEHSTNWDPFTVLRFGGSGQKYLYSQGKEVWDSNATVAFNICNPPLHDKLDYAYILMNISSGKLAVSINIEAPHGTINLPLNKNKHSLP